MKEEGRQGAGRNRDISSKKVLGNPILYAQFLRSNLKIPFLKNVRPEDIEDVSERYIPYLGTEFESDTVKRVHIHSQKSREIASPALLWTILRKRTLGRNRFSWFS